jgi:hypothetical protein
VHDAGLGFFLAGPKDPRLQGQLIDVSQDEHLAAIWPVSSQPGNIGQTICQQIGMPPMKTNGIHVQLVIFQVQSTCF